MNTNDIFELIRMLITILGLLLVILAVLSKMRMNEEYKQLKEAQIEILKERIENLTFLTLPNIREEIEKKAELMKKQFESTLVTMNNDLQEAQEKINFKDEEIKKIKEDHDATKEQLEKVIEDRKQLQLEYDDRKRELYKLKSVKKELNLDTKDDQLSEIDHSKLRGVTDTWIKLLLCKGLDRKTISLNPIKIMPIPGEKGEIA